MALCCPGIMDIATHRWALYYNTFLFGDKPKSPPWSFPEGSVLFEWIGNLPMPKKYQCSVFSVKPKYNYYLQDNSFYKLDARRLVSCLWVFFKIFFFLPASRPGPKSFRMTDCHVVTRHQLLQVSRYIRTPLHFHQLRSFHARFLS